MYQLKCKRIAQALKQFSAQSVEETTFLSLKCDVKKFKNF